MKKLLSVITLGILVLPACAGGSVGNYFAPTAAVVNGEKIEEARISAQLRLIQGDPQNAGLFAGSKGAQNRLDAQRQILEDAIRERVVVQEARTLGVTISDAEVKQLVDQQVRPQFPSEEDFRTFLKDNLLTEDFVLDFFSNQLLVQKIAESVTGEVEVEEQQLQEAFEANRAQYDQMVHLAHVLICSDFNPTERKCNVSDADRQTASEVAARAKAGEDFAALAREFSADPSAEANGGDLGFHAPGQFVEALDTVAFALQAGQVSDPVETEFGMHVMKAIERGRSFESVREELREELLTPMQQAAFQEWLTEKIRAARITINPRFGRFDKNTLTIVPIAPEREPIRQAPGPAPGEEQDPVPLPDERVPVPDEQVPADPAGTP